MAGKINHRFVSAEPDSADPTEIRTQSDWNDSLIISGGTDGQLMERNAGETDGWALTSTPHATQIVFPGGVPASPLAGGLFVYEDGGEVVIAWRKLDGSGNVEIIRVAM